MSLYARAGVALRQAQLYFCPDSLMILGSPATTACPPAFPSRTFPSRASPRDVLARPFDLPTSPAVRGWGGGGWGGAMTKEEHTVICQNTNTYPLSTATTT